MRSPLALRLAPFTAALLLAGACSQALVSQDQQSIPVEPDSGIGDGAPPIPADPPLSGEFAPQAVSQIPERFRGVWDADGFTCDPYSDMRLEIEADQVLFYESGGQVRSLQIEGDSMRLDLAMSGEDETWRSLLQFTLRDDGTLHIVDAATPDAQDRIPRRRCT